MQRGLEGRRVAVFAASRDDTADRRAAKVVNALEQAGARVHMLRTADEQDQWHGAMYAALVLVGDGPAPFEGQPRLVQLVREFFVSDKPVAAFGGALGAVLEAGGVAGRTVAAQGALKSASEKAGATSVDEPIHADEALITATGEADADAFAERVVRELAVRLEERDVDEMSELSFPASDPPAVSPSSIGSAASDRKGDARP